jgi:FkbM family methyltransferase
MNEERLRQIHSCLTIDYGSFAEEYPEQLMAATFLTGNEKVLELGGNIGRNSLIIGYILNQNNNNNFVTMETNQDDAKKLEHNRDKNNLNFSVENAALSSRKLIQSGWTTTPSDVVLDGYFAVNTITWQQLQDKYKIQFDTLVLDCEGAFYYILQDTPEILTNIKLIIVENDYFGSTDAMKPYVDTVLLQHNFYPNFQMDGAGYRNFYEVWKRR